MTTWENVHRSVTVEIDVDYVTSGETTRGNRYGPPDKRTPTETTVDVDIIGVYIAGTRFPAEILPPEILDALYRLAIESGAAEPPTEGEE